MRFFASCLAATLIAGCASAAAPDQGVDLTGVWQATAINGHATPSTDSYRVEFGNGRISGRFGCNSVNGGYRVRGDVLTAEPLAATEMACPKPGMTFEGWAFSVLQQPARVQSVDAGRRIQLANGAGTIMLERQQPVPVLAGSEWRVLSVNGVPPARPGIAMMRFTPYYYDATFGCNRGRGSYRQLRDRVEISLGSTTEKGCELSIMTYEDRAFSVLRGPGASIRAVGPDQLLVESSRGAILLQRVR